MEQREKDLFALQCMTLDHNSSRDKTPLGIVETELNWIARYYRIPHTGIASALARVLVKYEQSEGWKCERTIARGWALVFYYLGEAPSTGVRLWDSETTPFLGRTAEDYKRRNDPPATKPARPGES